MVVKVLAVDKNHRAIHYLQHNLDKQIVITNSCEISVAGKMYGIVDPNVLLIEIKWSQTYIDEVYKIISELFSRKPNARVVAMTTIYNADIERQVKELGVHGYVFLECSFLTVEEILRHFSQSIIEAYKGHRLFVM